VSRRLHLLLSVVASASLRWLAFGYPFKSALVGRGRVQIPVLGVVRVKRIDKGFTFSDPDPVFGPRDSGG
jgi:hypothetical protein